MSVQPKHPYLPKSLRLPNYRPNDLQVSEILFAFFGGVGIFLIGTWILAGLSKNPVFSLTKKLTLCWFVLCGLIHCILEGYFGVFHATMSSDMSFLGQVWKEYGKGDSRYISSDNFVVNMERITAFVDGPLCFLTVFLYFRNNPYRYLIQLIASLCQLYGDVLYFMTEIYDNFSHGYLYHPLYFWFYFVTLNITWIIIPTILATDACNHLAACQEIVDKRGASFTKSNKRLEQKKKHM